MPVGQRLGGDGLLAWAGRTGRSPPADQRRGGLRFVFYGRVSTEDYQDPVTSRARQVGQAEALVAGHGRVVAQVTAPGRTAELIDHLRAAGVTLIYDPAKRTVRIGTDDSVAVTIGQNR